MASQSLRISPHLCHRRCLWGSPVETIILIRLPANERTKESIVCPAKTWKQSRKLWCNTSWEMLWKVTERITASRYDLPWPWHIPCFDLSIFGLTGTHLYMEGSGLVRGHLSILSKPSSSLVDQPLQEYRNLPLNPNMDNPKFFFFGSPTKITLPSHVPTKF